MQFIDSALMSPTRLLLKYTIQNATRQRLEVSPYYQLSMMHDLCSGHHTLHMHHSWYEQKSGMLFGDAHRSTPKNSTKNSTHSS